MLYSPLGPLTSASVFKSVSCSATKQMPLSLMPRINYPCRKGSCSLSIMFQMAKFVVVDFLWTFLSLGISYLMIYEPI
jgi:hypothetical protein